MCTLEDCSQRMLPDISFFIWQRNQKAETAEVIEELEDGLVGLGLFWKKDIKRETELHCHLDLVLELL